MGSPSITFTLILAKIAITLIHGGHSYQVGNNPFRRAETLDPEGKYLLEWEVDWSSKRVTFNVTVETRNWVGLGVSNDGASPSSGADMVIGGVRENGQAYFSDRHRAGASEATILDKHQDWTLHSAWESRTHTSLCFSRALDTCDPEDYQITINEISLVWAYGLNDNEEGAHPQKSGTFGIHLLDPDYAPEIVRDRSGAPKLITSNRNENIPKDTQTWSVEISRVLPTNATSYYCSIHKAPRLQQRHHLIGYDIYFPNDESIQYPHHMLMYRCHPPSPSINRRDFFEPHLSNPGEPCYLGTVRHVEATLPTRYCSELYQGWAVGGRAYFLPNDVGFPLGESEDDFYMLQVHYANPAMQIVRVDIRFDFFYTSQLRPNVGGKMGANHEVPGIPESFHIPPNSNRHRILGHCSSECTRRLFPSEGIKVFSVSLHGHNSAVGVRLRHFRGGRELPWILHDDNYDNQVQPIRHLRRVVSVMPGDQLTVECHYSNNGARVGGFPTTQEMCVAYLFHYERVQNYSHCSSEIYSPSARRAFLGIGNFSWVEEELEWVVQTPPRYAGLKISEVSDRFVNWTPERRKQFQRFHEVHPHSGGCHKNAYARTLAQAPASNPVPTPNIAVSSLVLNTPDDYRGPVSYPFEAIPYSPPGRSCPL